ncbi:ABC transporter substrate-binding protein [Actinacidiphila sp. bgisy144]|uniref:ABC transporter substrate-binding protein n=1 Tax=Actinacidiphila sp. bgisy144 TaxID=3413791 RepID=UPI003EB992B7
MLRHLIPYTPHGAHAPDGRRRRAPGRWRRPGRMRAGAVCAAAVLAAGLLSACGGGDAGSGSTVTVGVGSNIFELPIRLAEANGYFARQGLKVKFVTLTAATGISALESGSVQFLNDSPTDFASAVAQHVPVKAIAADGVGNPLGLIVGTSFAKAHGLTAATPAAQVAKALAGSTGGASSSNTKAEAGLFLKAYGVAPDGVKWVSLPTPAADKAALKSHQIDWFTTSEPAPLQIQAEGDGVVVADATKVPVWSNARTGYSEVVVARSSYLGQHAATARKFATAVQQATASMNAHLDSPAVQAVARKALPGVPAGVLSSSLRLVDWPARATMTPAGWRTALTFINSLGALPQTAEVAAGDWTNTYLP